MGGHGRYCVIRDPAGAVSALGGIAVLLIAVWLLLAFMTKRVAYRSPQMAFPTVFPMILALVACATSVAIMLSGYATGGQLGLPLVGAIGGAVGGVAGACAAVATARPSK